MAARFARGPEAKSRYWRLASIAAALVIVAGGATWWNARRAPDTALLLAKAYTAARPFEYRLADAGYGPVRQERGAFSAFDRPAALNSADAQIQRGLASHPDDPTFLALKGHAQLLEKDYEGAIESLTRASELRPGDPELMADLGAAYGVRGDVEKRNIDYGHAVDLFLQALKNKPADQRILFNLALTYEKLWLVDEAVDTWTKFIAGTRIEGWRREAEAHRLALEKILQERKKAEAGVIRDPAIFIATNKGATDFDPDIYYEIFWTDWLPAAASNSDSREAAHIEALSFRRRFGDSSLIDTLTAPMEAVQRKAIARLRDVLAFNQSGQTDAAISAAREAALSLDAAGLQAGAIRARVELAYAYRRASMNLECLELTQQQIQSAESLSYIWLSSRAHTEHAACAERLGQSGVARGEAAATEDRLRRAGLQLPALRALGFITGIDRLSGDYVPVWPIAPSGLEAYWKSSASPLLAQQFQYSLGVSARSLEWKECAVVLFRAAIRSIKRAGNSELEAMNRIYLGDLLREMGDYQNELREYDTAEKLFGSIKPGPTLENLTWNARLARMEAEIATGHAGANISEIEKLARLVGSRSSLEQIRVQQALGLAFVAVGNWRAALDPFQKAVSWNQRSVTSLHSYVDRIPVVEPVGTAYRNLTQIQLEQQRNASSALETWMLYQTVGLGARSAANPAALTYAILPAGVAVWLSDGSGVVSARLVDAPAGEVEATCRRFLRLCATPSSNEKEIRETGNRLFRWLLEPEIRRYPEAIIRVRTDSWLGTIPFGALTDNSGHYLLPKWSFMETLGPSKSESLSLGSIHAGSSALLVAAPSARKPGGIALPALQSAEGEASSVARFFRNSTLLSGEQAGAEAISALSGRSDVFHFAGHGWANGGDGALILSPGAAGEPRLLTAGEIAREDWSRCSLAVLSACLTATGEERGAVNNQSLVRAFLSAGARRVIAARWSVDSEATSALMSKFYAEMISGKPEAESLARAALLVKGYAQWRHPYYWAGFDVFGN
jgi:CHAT domain-containing protein/cytochrome c-type biogenesis protein CcmH/NrfG